MLCFTIKPIAKVIDIFNTTNISAKKMHLQCKIVDKSGISYPKNPCVSL